jgi:hypothetical protein
MLKLLPALLPSWRFFADIAPSPRVEYAVLSAANAIPENWQEFRPRPQHVSVGTMLQRLLWNPYWNASLFVVSCSERLLEQHTQHCEQEIFRRIAADLHPRPTAWLVFRIQVITRQQEQLHRQVMFTSTPQRIEPGTHA